MFCRELYYVTPTKRLKSPATQLLVQQHVHAYKQGNINTLRPRQNGRHFTDDILKCIFMYENVWIPIRISLKFVPKRPINNIPPFFQIMAWRRPGDKPLSEPMMVRLPTHVASLGLNELKLIKVFYERIHRWLVDSPTNGHWCERRFHAKTLWYLPFLWVYASPLTHPASRLSYTETNE